MNKRDRGLTLIELLVVVAIIAILATVAVIGWGTLVRRSARADAIAALTDLRVKQEQYRFANPTYADSLVDDFDPDIPSTSPNGRYRVELVEGSVGSSGFVATATPLGSQEADVDCGTFAINQDGPLSTGAYAPASCWRR